MIRNIIFDWSGTLVDDLPLVWRATNHVFERAGIQNISLDKFRAEFCLPFKHFYDRYTPHISMPQLEEWFHAYLRQAEETSDGLPHAREFIDSCRRRGLRMFILSTMHREHFARQSVAAGFAECFERVYLEIYDKRAKIHSLLQENKLLPRETVFIGDMQHDIETARHGGVYSCAVLTGYTGLDLLRASQPDLIVEHLGELRALLDENEWDIERVMHARAGASGARPIATVGALILNHAGQVLMIRTHKWSGLWGIPGGKIKFGERAMDALRREISEETNLEITSPEFVLVQDCIDSKEFYRPAHFVLLNYVCRAVDGREVKLNEEAQEFCWVAPDAAASMALNEPTRRLISAVREKTNWFSKTQEQP
jgi:phosphoglycolate phosphatase